MMREDRASYFQVKHKELSIISFVKYPIPRTTWVTLLILAAGIILRLVVSQLGSNYDLESYMVVRDVLREGNNVYAETSRYNYAPVWFLILGSIDWLSSFFTFRNFIFINGITALLTLTDIGIFVILRKIYGLQTASLFFLNPISIIITGYHRQFDNLTLLVGLVSVLILPQPNEQRISLRYLAGLFVLGLSLAVKHIFFAFPLWVAMKQEKTSLKVLSLAIPVLVFLLSFLPFFAAGERGIINNVFLYKSFFNAPLFNLFSPAALKPFFNPTILWVTILVLCAVLFRKKPIPDSLFFYLNILVIASPAIANQYLAIVVPSISVFPNPFNLAYTITATAYLMIDSDALHVIQTAYNLREPFYTILMMLLLLSFLRLVIKPDMKKVLALFEKT